MGSYREHGKEKLVGTRESGLDKKIPVRFSDLAEVLKRELMITKQDRIVDISGHPMSGLWTLHLEQDTVHIESGTGVRALAACFGASEGAGDLQEKIQGQEIVYSVDEFGVLEGFSPASEWSGPEISPEGIEEEG